MALSRSLPELAHVISSCTNRIYDAYDDEGIPQPSFDAGADHFSGPFTPAVETSRVKLLEALDELRALIVGPAGHVFFLSFLIVSSFTFVEPRSHTLSLGAHPAASSWHLSSS